MLDKPEYLLDQIFFYVAIAHFGWVVFEVCIARTYMNSGVNLEQRIKQDSSGRIRDLVRLFIISAVIGAIFLVPAFKSFEAQECKAKYYNLGEYECQDCTDFHGEECLACQDALTCTSCVQGHYLENYECHICAEKWPNCVDCVYAENYDLLVKKSNGIQIM